MGSRVVPLRLDAKTLELISMLVRLGVFSSKSEALRELIKAGIKSYEGVSRIAKAVEELFKIEEKEKDIPIRLEGGLKQLLEERGRV
ncbi:MAG: ribbon-helix-helix protein, CopG family [Thermoprotei archaeon]|nr:ribbon-helix-helix protein, CopG family [Thermoprotei archaeon]